MDIPGLSRNPPTAIWQHLRMYLQGIGTATSNHVRTKVIDTTTNEAAQMRNAQMHKCTYVQIQQCSKKQMHKGSKCTNAQRSKCTKAQNAQMLKCTNSQAQQPTRRMPIQQPDYHCTFATQLRGREAVEFCMTVECQRLPAAAGAIQGEPALALRLARTSSSRQLVC